MLDGFLRFLLRWFMNGLGMWSAAQLLDGVDFTSLNSLIIAALIFSLINATIKPIVVILSLPAIVFSLGLFILIVNAFMVYLTSVFYEPFILRNFTSAVFAAIIIGLVNYLLSLFVDDKQRFIRFQRGNN